MRYAYSIAAAIFCLGALLANLLDMSRVIALICLGVAAVFLILALRANQTPQPGRDRDLSRDDLSNDQMDKIRSLLADGQFGTAVKQIQLWFKNVSYGEAEAFVKRFAK
ncbi:MAG: hypothetical protein ACTH1F_02905 [Corynebacterium casei]|uniref:hypothetical protein n=1 Tax=Corynebacterium casei TaxID=160386 RepID=UPI003F9228FF